jgi:hypothetical protein
MIVKSYKSRSEQSRAIYIIIGQFFTYKSAVLKSNTPVLEKSGEEIKSKSVELVTTTS